MAKSSKSKSQRIHAKKRAEERYGISLNRAAQREIKDAIYKGVATFVRKQSARVSIFDLEYQDKMVRVVYDKVRKNIVTFLPREPDENFMLTETEHQC